MYYGQDVKLIFIVALFHTCSLFIKIFIILGYSNTHKNPCDETRTKILLPVCMIISCFPANENWILC